MRKIVTFAFACLLASSALAEGEVYRWKDASGNWHYSDQPQPGAELIRGTRSPTPVRPTASPASQTVASNEAPIVSPEVAKQVRAEADAIKSEQCKKAEEVYQNSLNARRIYRVDEKGNRTYLSDAEIDATRLEARSNRDLACGS